MEDDKSVKFDDIEKILKPNSVKSENSQQKLKLSDGQLERLNVIKETIISLEYAISQHNERIQELKSKKDYYTISELHETIIELLRNIQELKDEYANIFKNHSKYV